MSELADHPSGRDGEASLGVWFIGWVESLSGYAPITRAAYVADVANFAELLLERLGRAPASPGVRRLQRADTARIRIAQIEQVARRVDDRPAPFVRCGTTLDQLYRRDLTGAYLVAVLDQLRERYAPAHVYRVVSSVNSFLYYLVERRVLASNPLESPAAQLGKVSRHDVEPLTHDELAALYATCDPSEPAHGSLWPSRDLAALTLLVTAGVGRDELTTLTVSALESTSDGLELHVLGPSGQRTLPITNAAAAAALTAYLVERASVLGPAHSGDPLFVRANGRPMGGRTLYRMVARRFELAGVDARPGTMVHLLRCTYVQRAVESGMATTEIQRLLGHANLVSTKRLLRALTGDQSRR